IETSEIEQLLLKVQQMDPPGIGGRSLQECLLLQVERKKDSPQKVLMTRVLTNYFDEFTKKHWHRIQQQLELNGIQMEALLTELRRLNPKPGAATGEAIERTMQQITPDFIVDTQDDGSISFSLNAGDMPRLEISQSFSDLLKDFQNNKDHMSRQQKEALLYTKQKVEAAQNFISAIQTRQLTLTKVMKAIIQLQRPFFEEGDEELLRPMILKDIATLTGQDLSTISRVTSSKYVQTRWGTFPLKFFFSDGYVTNSGEELSTRKIKVALRDIIDSENKHKPLSDDALRDALEQKGFPIARRTVAKYREQLGVPVARLRKS
ncbi:MAG: RNA polymerase factor sigma-54, partial [Prevotella sp.]|nr:RNA polymerase factor sigma-54 [Prevotella sp.]